MLDYAIIALTLAQDAEAKAGSASSERVIERAKAYLNFLSGQSVPVSESIPLPPD